MRRVPRGPLRGPPPPRNGWVYRLTKQRGLEDARVLTNRVSPAWFGRVAQEAETRSSLDTVTIVHIALLLRGDDE